MERHGFTLDQIRHITTKIPSILVQDETVLEQRLNLLLTLKDSSPTYITAASTDSTMYVISHCVCNYTSSISAIDNVMIFSSVQCNTSYHKLHKITRNLIWLWLAIFPLVSSYPQFFTGIPVVNGLKYHRRIC
jgi:hypothetical protein